MRKVVATELELRAAEAWKLLSRKPNILDSITGREAMSPGVAIDYVQDVTGDRDEAVMAIINAAADWLDSQTVPGGDGEIHAGCLPDSELIRNYLRGECMGLALVFIVHIRDRCYRASTTFGPRGDWFAAQDWNAWADKALIAIDHCRAVAAAAYPVEV